MANLVFKTNIKIKKVNRMCLWGTGEFLIRVKAEPSFPRVL